MLGITLVVAGLVGGRLAAAWIPELVAWVNRSGAAGPAVFVAGYALGTVLLIPGSFMTLAAGAMFGMARGTLLVAAGASLGMVLAFAVSRRLARQLVERLLAGSARLDALDRAVGEGGWRIVLLLRLAPLIPFAMLNYLLGLTRVRLRDFLIGAVGILPWTAVYAWAGAMAGNVASVSAGSAQPHTTPRLILMLLGILATLLVAVVVGRRARQVLAEMAPDLGA